MNVLHIARRELVVTFSSAVGWLVATGFLALTGLFWIAGVQSYVLQGEDLVYDPFGASRLNLTDHLLSPFFGNTSIVLMMVVPALSMRLFSEEIKQRTLELLLTSPVTTLEIVLGKYLGMVLVVALLLAGTLHGPLLLWLWTPPDPGALAGGYLGLLLLAGSLLSLGLFLSSLTSSQVVALVLSFAGALLLLVISWLSRDPEDVFAQISLMDHLTSLVRGEVRVSDLTYYGAFIFVFLFATVQRMESFRWR